MKTIIRVLSTVVRKAPVVVLISAVAITAAFGYFGQQARTASGNEGFSPDSDEFAALITIGEEFSDNSEVPVQIVISQTGGDVITGDGLRAYADARHAITESRASELLNGRPQGDIVGFLDLTLMAATEQGIDLATIDDPTVKQLFTASLDAVPEEFSDLFVGLLSTNADLSAPSSPAGLMVVFLNVAVLENDEDMSEQMAIHVDMADHLRVVDDRHPVSVEPFSLALLFAGLDDFQEEIARLFAMAFLIILVLLGFVYWCAPRGGLSLGGALRRTAADVLLTLGVVVMSIVWMNGIGVLLGPDYLGVIGAFSELVQVVPILLIALGIDYAIHLTSRYRAELGKGSTVADAVTRAARTVGVALVLATVTTVVGFLTNIFSPVTAIADFGIMVAVGIASAFLLMLTFVPAVRLLLDRRAEAGGRLAHEAMGRGTQRVIPRVIGSMSVVATKIPVVMIAIAVAMAAVGGIGWSRLDTRFSFTDFVPDDSPLLATYDTITEEFGGGFGERTHVLIEGDVARPAVHNALGMSQGALGTVPHVLLAGGQAQAESPLTVLFLLTTPPEQGGEPEMFSAEFAAQAADLGLQPDLSVSPDADVAALYAAATQVAPDAMRRVVAEVDGQYRYIDVSIATQGGDDGAKELHEGLLSAFAPVNGLDGVMATPTSDFIVSVLVVEAMQSSQMSSLMITLGAAMLLLVINFLVVARRPLLGVLTIFPVVLVVLWVFGMMYVVGIPLNPITAMIASVSIGIGAPYTIHITHRYQEDRVREADPDAAIRATMTNTGGALASAAFTTVAGFGILVSSSLVPFRQFGVVVSIAIGFAMLGAVLVLPSLLVLWDRWHRRRGSAAIDEAALEEALS